MCKPYEPRKNSFIGRAFPHSLQCGNVITTLLGAVLLFVANSTAHAATLTKLASFKGTNGGGPQGRLILSGNTLYGTTSAGGAKNDGVIFSLPTTGGSPRVLASFSGTDGDDPQGLILSGNTLYGTTTFGGARTAYT